MKDLTVSIEINGKQQVVGTIRGNDFRDACFSYGEAYMQESGHIPVSVSLPFQEEPFSPERTRCFFEGLLPEGFTRRSVASWMHVDEFDYLSILTGLGQECLGALRIWDGQPSRIEASYEKLSVGQVKALAREGATKSAELVTQAHLSLTGASGKAGLYFDEENQEWYLPRGNAPSTHIVKQSHIRLDAIVTNEQLAQKTAAMVGIRVPDSFIINVGKSRDEDVLFATRRYDRLMAGKEERIGNLRCPRRLHQEDFAQALGISAEDKYEGKPGSGYLKKMFRLLRSYSADPVRDQLRIWDMVVYDFLVGNTDCHLKNFSLVYGPDMRSIRLAPAYDILSTSIYQGATRDMAFRIGSAWSLDEITRESFLEAAGEVGIGSRMAMRRFDQMCGLFETSLKTAADELEDKGFLMAGQLKDRILQTGGYASLA